VAWQKDKERQGKARQKKGKGKMRQKGAEKVVEGRRGKRC